MTKDERSFLELVSLVKRGNKKGSFSKFEATAQKTKRDPKIKSKVIFKLHGHKKYDAIEISYKVSWRNEASGFMTGKTEYGTMLFGSVRYIVSEVMDYLDKSVQEEIVYNLEKF